MLVTSLLILKTTLHNRDLKYCKHRFIKKLSHIELRDFYSYSRFIHKQIYKLSQHYIVIFRCMSAIHFLWNGPLYFFFIKSRLHHHDRLNKKFNFLMIKQKREKINPNYYNDTKQFVSTKNKNWFNNLFSTVISKNIQYFIQLGENFSLPMDNINKL